MGSLGGGEPRASTSFRMPHLPVNETQLVNSFDSQNDLSNVEASDVLREDLILDEHSHQVTSRQELHQHIEEVGILEGIVELDDPRTVGLSQNVSLSPNVSQLVSLEHLGLDQRLHGVYFSILLLLYQLDLAEGSFANDLDGVIVGG